MSHGAGHVFDMINRMKQNRALKPSKKPKFKESSHDLIFSSKEEKNDELKFKEVPEEELKIIKQGIRNKARKEQIFELSVALILVVAFFSFVVWWLFF